MRFVIIFLISLQCLAQQGVEVTYAYKTNYQKAPSNKSFYGKLALKAKQVLPTLDFVLKANAGESSYQYNQSMINDASNPELFKMILGFAKADAIYYGNQPNNIFITQKNAFGKLYKIESAFSDLSWHITNMTQEILGFKCKKAVLRYNEGDGTNQNQKREIVAWFTPKLNLPFGPIGFRGLPGLILRLEYKWNFGFVLESTKIKRVNDQNIQKPTKGESIKIEDYRKLSR
ncbi:GLPGLI family protein [Psychroflexus salarius]|uniref:GLPGLI family protein n=1 Tax=Psychroflexus salarius TaxID=1155689 RepID=A0A1M4TUQ8_9FLAO|nr:GLPGLI family protein [Psychroflexus salarius]SHE48219.1 GLPGLI family protein [Psychroflexus salarius]